MAAKLYKNPHASRIYETQDHIDAVLKPEYFNPYRHMLALGETLICINPDGRYHLRIAQMEPYVQAEPDADQWIIDRLARLERLMKVLSISDKCSSPEQLSGVACRRGN